METQQWSTIKICPYCKHRFTIQASDVRFEDLRQPYFFVADWQYFVKCSECNHNILLHDIPSHIAIWIQTKLHTPK